MGKSNNQSEYHCFFTHDTLGLLETETTKLRLLSIISVNTLKETQNNSDKKHYNVD